MLKTKGNIVKLFKGFFWSCLALAFFVLCTASVERVEGKMVKEVVYHLQHLTDGNDLITVNEIKEKIFAIYDLDLAGVETERINLADLESILQEEAFIVSADAYIDAQHNLHIDISQRTPILRVMDLMGNNYYLDCEGIKLPLSRHFTARVPIVSGSINEYHHSIDSTQGILRETYSIVRAARDDALMSAWLEGVHVTNDGEILLNGNLGKFDVIFGNAQNIEDKFKKLKTFFVQGLSVTGWKELESINLAFEGQVVTRTRSKT